MKRTDAEKQEAFLMLQRQYASNLYNNGNNSYEVKIELIKRGVDEAVAIQIAESLDEVENTTVKDKARKDMLYGALFCVVGVLLSLFTVWIFVGLIMYGLMRFARAASTW